MNRLALGFGLSLLLFFNLSTNAQDNKTSGDDASAVRATVTNYIEAYYIGDAARMEQTLHPHYLKHKIHGHIPMREQTGQQLVQGKRLTLSPTEGSRSDVVIGPSHTQRAETLPENVCMPAAALCVCRITTDAAFCGHADRPHCRLC